MSECGCFRLKLRRFAAADNRAMRHFSKQAYMSGVVIIKCPECGSRHLIADRLGWFGDNASVETILKEKGQGECSCVLVCTTTAHLL